MSQKKKETKFVLQNTLECKKLHHFFNFFPEPPPAPLQHSLALSKLNFATPIEIRWLRLCYSSGADRFKPSCDNQVLPTLMKIQGI